MIAHHEPFEIAAMVASGGMLSMSALCIAFRDRCNRCITRIKEWVR